MTEDNRSKLIRKAAVIALTGNLLLTAVKLTVAFISGSLAVLGDGIDSASDVLIAIVTLVISVIISQPSDTEHPWGHGRAETVATLILVFIIFIAGSEVTISSVKRIFSKEELPPATVIAVAAPLISVIGKFILAITQSHFAQKANSDIIRANAQNMKNDILLSLGVLAGLGAAWIFKAPILDPIIALLVGLWVIKNAVSLFIDLNRELMDGNTDNTLYKKLFDAASSVEGVSNPHRARIRKIAALFDIDLDIEVDPNLTVYEAHEKAELVEDAIRSAIPDLYDVVIHIEPVGSDAHQRKEEFGVSPEHIS